MGNRVPRATRKILAASSMPNQRITRGISARWGTLRIICKVLSNSWAPRRDSPVMKPRVSPRPPPMAKPMMARSKLAQRCSSRTPDCSSSHPAATTAVGAGRTRADSQPRLAASCQRLSSNKGTSQGRPYEASCCSGLQVWSGRVVSFMAMFPSRCGCLRTVFVSHDFPEGAGELGLHPGLSVLQRQVREQQLGGAVRFLQVRIARQHEGFDAQLLVFLHALGHGGGI